MAPKGRSVRAKEQVEENGKGKRTRNVKAASYKDLSDSEEEDKVRKSASEESNSEEDRPKKRRAPKRKTSARRKQKGASDSESEYKSSEGDSDDEPVRKSRTPVRSSLRASKSTSYKDLSNSEDEPEPVSSQVQSRKGKQTAKKTRKVAKKSEKEELSESESVGKEGEEAESLHDKEKNVEDNDQKKEDVPEESSIKGEESSSKVEENELADQSKNNHKAEDNADETSLKDEVSSKSSTSGRPDHELSSDDEGDEKTDVAPKKRGRTKKADDSELPTKKAKTNEEQPKLNRTDTDYKSMDFSSNATNQDGKLWNLKISSWNVAGLKAVLKKNALDFIEHEKPDILCLQETKCSEKKLPPEARVEGYHTYWHSGEKEGYAGVAILSKQEPLNVKYGIDVKEFDNDGRVITAEYEKFFLVNAYVPNAGQGLKSLPRRLEWDPAFRSYLKKLDDQKPVVLCGDLNVSHAEIDLANPKTNTKSAGFTPQEREGMTELLNEGFVDSFRHLYPDKTGAYSFWSYFNQARSRNIGWRLDYFILSKSFLPNLCDNIMRSEVYGSDHCPITLLLNI